MNLPFVKGAVDYRVMILPAGASVNGLADGTEQVQGATMWCAGEMQRYSGDSVWIYKGTGNPALDLHTTIQPGTGYQPDPSHVVNLLVRSTPMNVIEVTGLTQSQTVYVEALDRLCPFTGIIGLRHQEEEVQRNLWPSDGLPVNNVGPTFLSEVSPAETVARYGNLIYNGQGHDPGTVISAPAAPNTPKILARTTVTLTPDTSAPVPTQFFDDFTDADQPFVAKTPPANVVNPNTSMGGVMQTSSFLQNDKWDIYASVAPGNPQTSATKNVFLNTSQLSSESTFEAYIAGGTLHMILGDYVQDVGASITAIPKGACASARFEHFEISACNIRGQWCRNGSPVLGGLAMRSRHCRSDLQRRRISGQGAHAAAALSRRRRVGPEHRRLELHDRCSF